MSQQSDDAEAKSLVVFWFRCLAFAAIVWGLQGLLAGLSGLARPGAVLSRLAAVDGVRAGDILYFGDSVLGARAAHDPESSELSHLVRRGLAPARVSVVAHAAFQPRIYEAILGHLLRSGRPPERVIVPINLRSFAPPWSERPSYQFAQEVSVLAATPGLADPFLRWRLAFKEFPPGGVDPPPQDLLRLVDFAALRATFPALSPSARPNIAPDATDMVRASYLTPLDVDHPYLVALVRICEQATRAESPTLAYLTPVDFEEGSHLLGTAFRETVSTKAAWLRAALKPAGCDFADWSTTLDGASFGWREEGKWINEHLNRRGRETLASMIKAHLAR